MKQLASCAAQRYDVGADVGDTVLTKAAVAYPRLLTTENTVRRRGVTLETSMSPPLSLLRFGGGYTKHRHISTRGVSTDLEKPVPITKYNTALIKRGGRIWAVPPEFTNTTYPLFPFPNAAVALFMNRKTERR